MLVTRSEDSAISSVVSGNDDVRPEATSTAVNAGIQHLPIPSIQFATHMNDYVKASSMFEAYNGEGEMCFKNQYEIMAKFKPSRRAENWFRKMLENRRGYLTEAEQAFIRDDRYADTIIGERHGEYDAVEIQGVRDHQLPSDPGGSCCEVDNENPQLFSVYAHLKEGGVDCVGDFATHTLADAYAKELGAKYHWPIRDFVPSRLKATVV